MKIVRYLLTFLAGAVTGVVGFNMFLNWAATGEFFHERTFIGSMDTFGPLTPETFLPAVQVMLTKNPDFDRFEAVALDFAKTEGLSAENRTFRRENNHAAVIVTIPLGDDSRLFINKPGQTAPGRIELNIRAKAMADAPKHRAVFDRLIAKMRDSFPDHPLEEVTNG